METCEKTEVEEVEDFGSLLTGKAFESVFTEEDSFQPDCNANPYDTDYLCENDDSEGVTKYSWNPFTEKCTSFTYYCGGNGNRFNSEQDCYDTCPIPIFERGFVDESVCNQEIDSGMCRSSQIRFGYSASAEKCVKFEYTGCGGNQNNFMSKAECKATCMGKPSSPILPAESGAAEWFQNILEPEEDENSFDGFFDKIEDSVMSDNQGLWSPRVPQKAAQETRSNQSADDNSVCQERIPNKVCQHLINFPMGGTKWGYNSNSNLCVEFEYWIQCLDDDRNSKNVFNSEKECKNACISDDYEPFFFADTENSKYCSEPKDDGESCVESEHIMHYYDSEAKRCLLFGYGGCGGNNNKFVSYIDCTTACHSDLHIKDQNPMISKSFADGVNCKISSKGLYGKFKTDNFAECHEIPDVSSIVSSKGLDLSDRHHSFSSLQVFLADPRLNIEALVINEQAFGTILHNFIPAGLEVFESKKAGWIGVSQKNGFNFAQNLKILNLQDNVIKTLEPKVFSSNFQLTELYLDGNLIKSLPKNIFHGLSNLKVLSLGRNSISSFDGEFFIGLNALKDLTLKNCPLEGLSKKQIMDMPSLKNLDVSGCDGLDWPFKLAKTFARIGGELKKKHVEMIRNYDEDF